TLGGEAQGLRTDRHHGPDAVLLIDGVGDSGVHLDTHTGALVHGLACTDRVAHLPGAHPPGTDHVLSGAARGRCRCASHSSASEPVRSDDATHVPLVHEDLDLNL